MKVKNDCRDFNDYSPNLWRKNIDMLLNIVREIDTTINQRTLIKRLNVFLRMSHQVKPITTSQTVLQPSPEKELLSSSAYFSSTAHHRHWEEIDAVTRLLILSEKKHFRFIQGWTETSAPCINFPLFSFLRRPKFLIACLI